MTDLADAAPVPNAVDPEKLAWEDPPRTGTPGSAPVLSVSGFEGPLDWLVELARARKIDLARLSIVDLVQAFCEAMAAALSSAPGPEMRHLEQAAAASVTASRLADLARWADWLVLTATLTQLRSRLLLPADAPKAQTAQSEAEALRRQLVGRAQMRAAADWLEQRPQLGRDAFPSGNSETALGSRRATDITDLLRACLVALRVPEEQAAAYRPRAAPLWRVSDAMNRIKAVLKERPQGGELEAFLPEINTRAPGRELRCKAAVASTLVAGLDLAREGIVYLDQKNAESPVLVCLALG